METARFDTRIPIELQDLFLCDCCQQPFNNDDALPKLLACRHYFCAACVSTTMQLNVGQIECMHCARYTHLSANSRGADGLPTQQSIVYLVCNISLIRFPTQLTSRTTTPTPTNAEVMKSPSPTGSLQPYQRQSQSPQHRQLQRIAPSGHHNHQQRTAAGGGENCHTHAMPNSLWCRNCLTMMCRGCAATDVHRDHTIRLYTEQLLTMWSDLKDELQAIKGIILQLENLTDRQREVQLKVLTVCDGLRTQLESNRHKQRQRLELTTAWDMFDRMSERMAMLYGRPPTEAGILLEAMHVERMQLQTRNDELFVQCRLDELVGCGVPLSNAMIRKTMGGEVTDGWSAATAARNDNNVAWNATVLLANFCVVQLYACQYQGRPLTMACVQLTDSTNELPEVVRYQHLAKLLAASTTASSSCVTPELMADNQLQLMQPIASSRLFAPRARLNPIYYFDIQINGLDRGRILIEVFTDRAPHMAFNFDQLANSSQTIGSYKGCQFFQCWENESIITGDVELNNGHGGRSVFEERLFMPDDSQLKAIEGSVGMRRTQKRQDSKGLVGSQFRVILRQMPSFTGIFGHVVDGLGLVEQISRTGDETGKPRSRVTVADCGMMQ